MDHPVSTYSIPWANLKMQNLKIRGDFHYSVSLQVAESVSKSTTRTARRGPPPSTPTSSSRCTTRPGRRSAPLSSNSSPSSRRPDSASWTEASGQTWWVLRSVEYLEFCESDRLNDWLMLSRSCMLLNLCFPGDEIIFSCWALKFSLSTPSKTSYINFRIG